MRTSFGGDGDGIGIEIDARELDRDAARAGPELDAAEGVAVTAGDVDDVERFDNGRCGGSCGNGIEPTQQRAVSQKPAIEAREVAEASAELLAGAGLIH